MTNVLIVDPHPLFRAALRELLQGLVHMIAEAPDLSCVEGISQSLDRVDLALLDLQILAENAKIPLDALKQKFPEMRVIGFSRNDSLADRQRALDLRLSGYLLKSMDAQPMKSAIEAILMGETVPPQNERMDFCKDRPSWRGNLEVLSPQELRVLQLVAEGLMNKQIAFGLGLSQATVKCHMSSIMQKLGVTNRTQAAMAIRYAKAAPKVG